MILIIILRSKDDIVVFNSYTFTFKMKKVKSIAELLDRGAFGILYKGYDTIVAKRINEHRRLLAEYRDNPEEHLSFPDNLESTGSCSESQV